MLQWGRSMPFLQHEGRVEYTYATDDEALAAFKELAQTEGILPALETSHGIAYGIKVAGSSAEERYYDHQLFGSRR